MPPLKLTACQIEDLSLLLHSDTDGTDSFAWFDRTTGDTVIATSLYGLDRDGDEDEDLRPDDSLPQWQREERERVRAILADETDRYIDIPMPLPTRGRPIADFADTLPDRALAAAVLEAARGRGAFRRVKDLLYARGELALWHAFENERQRVATIEWLADEGVEWTEA